MALGQVILKRNVKLLCLQILNVQVVTDGIASMSKMGNVNAALILLMHFMMIFGGTLSKLVIVQLVLL